MYRYTNISFPSLGIDIDPVRQFSVGPLTIHLYGVVIAFGLVLATMYCMRRSKEFGLTEDHVLDGVLWITPFAILCARAYYCIFSWSEYKDDPISVLYIWKGGLAIYGGIIAGCTALVLTAVYKKINPLKVMDAVGPGVILAQAIGRWGNFMNGEAFGYEVAEGSLLYPFRMGLISDYTHTGSTMHYYHPTFLYESLWNIAGFILIACIYRKKKFNGQMALTYFAWYGFGRMFIEGLRTDSLWWGNFRVSQVLAAVTCVTAVSILIWQHFKPHDPANLWVNQVAAMKTEE